MTKTTAKGMKKKRAQRKTAGRRAGRKNASVPRPPALVPDAGFIRVRGACEHNLKNVDVDIPRNKLIVVTGLSGSGKSSLAFDTVYAEGQRRYIESLSAYARQFLARLEKPDVEHIEGLTPTIAIGQRTGRAGPRSTVATATEIYDYLRVLYARVGTPHCPKCGRVIETQSAETIVERLSALPEGSRLTVLAPLVRGRKGEHREILAAARREGFPRLRVDGEIVDAREVPKLDKRRKHEIHAVVDRLLIREDNRARLTESVELALKVGEGLVVAHVRKDAAAPGKEYIYSERYACPKHGVGPAEMSPRIFSFNSPYGACPTCAGLGAKPEIDPDLLLGDRSRTLEDGLFRSLRRLGFRYGLWYQRAVRRFCRTAGVSLHVPMKKLPKKAVHSLLYGPEDSAVPVGDPVRRGRRRGPFPGLIPSLSERFQLTNSEAIKQRLHEFMSAKSCPACRGARLRPEVLAVRIGKYNIAEAAALSVVEAREFFAAPPLKGEKKIIAVPLLKEINDRLRFLGDVGLGYLTLDRASDTLSGGEAQRIRLAGQVGSKLSGVTYVLDEPTIGLHQRDNQRLLRTLAALRDLGNTVLVVEHDEEVIRSADYLLDLGPGAGERGGELVARGTVEDLANEPRSLTGRRLAGVSTVETPKKRRPVNRRRRFVRVVGARQNNLKNITVDFPLSRFICVTGVSGSGKSSLVNEVLYKSLARMFHGAHETPGACDRVVVAAADVDKVVNVDQSPIGRTPRSNPATYTGVFDEIRRLFAALPEAKVRGYTAGRFSFNVKGGRCEHCQGQGSRTIEMHFVGDVSVRCEQCGGRRFNRETLEVKFKGCSIAEVLEMSVRDASALFKNHPKIIAGLKTLTDVGLGYIRLGQSSTTLSGGEAQRVKLSYELGKKTTGGTFYVLDEPTTGLHFHDIAQLLEVLQRLVDLGNTVVVIEHNPDVIKTADRIIDLGPEGGDAGGRVVAEGTPEEVAACEESLTGQFLRGIL